MSEPASKPVPERIGWLDSARGLGIVLVVIGHALGGLIDSPMGDGQDAFRRADFIIYTFHMPLFFLLSGLLVTKRLEKGRDTFLRGIALTVAWPYFLWAATQHTLIWSLGALVNSPAESLWPTLLSLPWQPVSQFWFLFALFWMHILAVVLLPHVRRQGFVMVALGLKALLLIVVLPMPFKLVFNHMLFYAIGVWLGTAGIDAIVLRNRPWIKAAVLPLLAAGVIYLTLTAVDNYGIDIPLLTANSSDIAILAWRFPAMSAAILGVAAILGIASLKPFANSAWLAMLGRMTMPIFVLHIIFMAGARIVLTRFGIVTDPQVLLPIMIVAGIAGPLIAERILRPLGLQKFLGF